MKLNAELPLLYWVLLEDRFAKNNQNQLTTFLFVY